MRKMKSNIRDLDKGIDGLSNEPKVKLVLDSHGILLDKQRIAKNQLACMLFCCCPPVLGGCCAVCCNYRYFDVLFNGTLDKQIEAASGSHKVYIAENAVGVERTSYTTNVIKNFTSVDQV